MKWESACFEHHPYCDLHYVTCSGYRRMGWNYPRDDNRMKPRSMLFSTTLKFWTSRIVPPLTMLRFARN